MLPEVVADIVYAASSHAGSGVCGLITSSGREECTVHGAIIFFLPCRQPAILFNVLKICRKE